MKKLLLIFLFVNIATSQEVIKVVDGDTLTLRNNIKVRISAIDAPEIKQDYGRKSGAELYKLCYRKQAVLTNKSKDRWGRVVADVACDGVDVGAFMVSNGYAWVYPQYAPKKRYSKLYELEADAKKAQKGLWLNKAVEPWLWRKNKL